MRLKKKYIRIICCIISIFLIAGLLLVYTPLNDIIFNRQSNPSGNNDSSLIDNETASKNDDTADEGTTQDDTIDVDDINLVLKIKDADFGSRVIVEFDNDSCPEVKKYQIYDGDKAISAISDISEATTILPEKEKKPGDKLKIKLMDDKEEEIAFLDVTLAE